MCEKPKGYIATSFPPGFPPRKKQLIKSFNPVGSRGALWSDFVGVTKWPLELADWGCAGQGASPPRRFWGVLGPSLAEQSAETRKQGCLCCNFGRPVRSMPEGPSSLIYVQRQTVDVLQSLGQPYA